MATVTAFSVKPFDRSSFETAMDDLDDAPDFSWMEARLDVETARLAADSDIVCAFVNDDLSAPVLEVLARGGTTAIVLRCAGFNNVDIEAASTLGIRVLRVPAYSPNAVAEHTLALILALNRKIHRAHNRVRDGNFRLDGLVGFDVAGTTVAVVGTGRIGGIVARLLWHMRCEVLAVDSWEDPHLVDLGVQYTTWDDARARARIITLNCPLTEETHHLIDAESIAAMQPGVMIVNTGRGPLIDTEAVVEGLKDGHIGALALDVYEEEGPLFFEDRSAEILTDDTFARLLTFHNVLITAHQAFLTNEALEAIATTTLQNIAAVRTGQDTENEVRDA